jgi:hypothetical protein
MIKFLRIFRQKLIDESKVRRYFFYAFGEILLVMVGIILAIQFDNWNSRRLEIKKEIWYLNNIADDMFYQEEELKYIKTFYEKSIKDGLYILSETAKTNDFSKIDSLDAKINSLLISTTIPNINNTYQEMISSGKQSLIENKDLSSNIIDFYLLTQETESSVQSNINNVYYQDIFPVLLKYSQVSLNDMELPDDHEILLYPDKELSTYIFNELKKPKNKLALLNAIKNKVLIMEDHLSRVILVLEETDKMVSEIEAEIEKLK